MCSKHYNRWLREGTHENLPPLRLPLEPLLSYLKTTFPERTHGDYARMMGIALRNVQRWFAGHVTSIELARADRIAIRLGSHPLLIWGEDYWKVRVR